MQTNIFELMYETYKIKKPIRLIEFFAGYGSQALALKYLGVPFEHWKICEWAVKSIQAYKDIHFTYEKIHRVEKLSKDYLVDHLYKKGISSNYNEPMSKESIAKLSEDKLIQIYDNIQITNNLVNIQQVKAKDLEIKDTDEFTYLLTYSFPCQDLSLAGKGKGMSDTSTRSGMLWEVERILTECKELGNMPEILLMENVPQVHSQDNVKDFNKWQLRLEELGYKNYFQDLIATDYGIPQTRNRCFMVSILGDYSYTFPPKQELKLKLKDMLEDEVDESYYLSDKQIEDIQHWNAYEKPLENMEKIDKSNISPTLTTRSGAYAAGMVLVKDGYVSKKYKEFYEENGYIPDMFNTYNKKEITNVSPTLTTECGSTTSNSTILIKNATKQGYLEATDGDGIDISSRMKYHRGTVQKGMCQTLDCKGGDSKGVVVVGNYTPSKHNASRIVDPNYSAPTVMENHGTITGVIVNEDNFKKKLCNKLINDGLCEEGDIIKHSYTQQIFDGNKKCVEKNDGNMITLTTRGDCVGVVVKDNSMYSESEKQLFTEDGNIKRYLNSDIVDKFEEGQMVTTTFPNGYGHGPRTHNESIALNTIDKPSVKQNLRIRKITPKECFRLMGVKDEDYENCANNQSNASLYHLAGDSICTSVLMAIFGELLDIDWRDKFGI